MTNEDQNTHDHENESLKEFEAKQTQDLKTFEANQAHALEQFEATERKELEAFEAEHRFDIKIDRTVYTVRKGHMTGEEIRYVPEVPIGPDRDLFEVKPGGSDVKILNGDTVKIHDGLRFFTAPAQINPGLLEGPDDAAL